MGRSYQLEQAEAQLKDKIDKENKVKPTPEHRVKGRVEGRGHEQDFDLALQRLLRKIVDKCKADGKTVPKKHRYI